MVLAEFQLAYLLPIAGLVLIAGSAAMMWRRRQATHGNAAITPREELERNRQLRGMRGDLEELMTEIEQLAKRLSAQLDAKTVELDKAIRRAEQKLIELRQLTGDGKANGAKSNAPAATGAATFASNTGTAAASAANAAASEAAPDLGPQDPLARSVHQLADRGLSATAIAQPLTEHIGKIELILALKQVSSASSTGLRV